jgi:hypothetical protein
MSLIAPTLQAFFTDRLITQRNCSPETIASYRDSLRLLLEYAHEQTGKQPFQLDFSDLDAPLIGAFLTHLEEHRGNSVRTRNNSPRGDPLPLSVCRPEASRARPDDRQGHGDPHQAPSARGHLLPRPGRDQGAAQGSGPQPLAGPPRSRAAAHPDPDRAARLRAHRSPRARHHPRHGRPRAGHGQGTKTAHRYPHPRDRRGPAPVAHRTPRPARRSLFSTRQGTPLTRDTVGLLVAKHTPHPAIARRSTPSASLRTCCATPTRCCSKLTTSTSPRSPCGSGTSAPPPPRSTSTPTPRSRNEPSRESPRSEPNRADTAPPTRCSPSSKPSDYAEHPSIRTIQLSRQNARRHHPIRHNQPLGMSLVMPMSA